MTSFHILLTFLDLNSKTSSTDDKNKWLKNALKRPWRLIEKIRYVYYGQFLDKLDTIAK